MTEINFNQVKKDRREWNVMKIFRQNCQMFPLGELEKSERPDFLVRTANKLVGIELTELKYERKDKEFNMRAHEDFLEELMTCAQTIFEKDCGLKLVVDVHFHANIGPAVAMDKNHEAMLIMQGLAETIARLVTDNTPDATGISFLIDRSSKYGYYNLPSMIESVRVTNVMGRFTESLWYAGISTKVKPLSVESISQRIKAKDKKLKAYNHKCAETWLVIIQNSFLMSSKYDPVAAQRALNHRYRSDFDRVFVLERAEGIVTLLNTYRPRGGEV